MDISNIIIDLDIKLENSKKDYDRLEKNIRRDEMFMKGKQRDIDELEAALQILDKNNNKEKQNGI